MNNIKKSIVIIMLAVFVCVIVRNGETKFVIEAGPLINETWVMIKDDDNPFKEAENNVEVKVLDIKDGYILYKFDFLPYKYSVDEITFKCYFDKLEGE